MPDSCDQLRAQIRALQGERRSLESKRMQPQGMLAASLVERFLRAGGTPRAAPAYYLSRSEHSRSTLTYVKKEELAVVRQHCAAYRAFQQNLKQWRRVTAALQQRWEAVAAGPISIKHFFQFFVDFAGHSTAGVSQIEGMMGSVPRPVTAAVGGDSFRIWQKDRQRVEQDIVEGRPFEAFISERGRFDGMFDFMLRSGLWAAATEMRPSGLKKDNGIPYRLLNGVECLREMAGIDTPANCGPLLKDSYLLERIGFTAEKVESRLRNDRTVIDPESLLNHLDRFTEQDLEAGFLQHLEVIRHKRWLRGGVYAVDGHDILIPYGQGYEGARRISEGAYGYKLLVLLNIQEGCELIVGFILGGLQESEITMLRRMLARLDKTMGPLREWLKILLMDRGYWGTDLFCELKQDYGIDFVSRVRDEGLDLNDNIQQQLEEADRSWSNFQEQRQFSGRQETQNVRVTALRPITLISDETAAHRQIAVNVVVAIQSHPDGAAILDKNGKDISRTDYVTSLATGRHGGKVRGFYRGRWGIENQGFRWLSQTWDIDRPAGHSDSAVLARLVFVFMIYNARHLFEKESRHRPDYAEQLRQMRSYGPGIALAGAAIVALTASGYCCALTARELLKLQKQRLLKKIERGLEAGKSVKEVMRELDNT